MLNGFNRFQRLEFNQFTERDEARFADANRQSLMGGARGCDGSGGDTPGGQMRSTNSNGARDSGVSRTRTLAPGRNATHRVTDPVFSRASKECSDDGCGL